MDERTWLFIANSWTTVLALLLVFGAVVIFFNESAKRQKRGKK